MESDDHYIPDRDDAHLDTRAFAAEIERLARSGFDARTAESERALRAARRHELFRTIYDRAEALAGRSIAQPADDDLLCRYLWADKFIWFIHEKSVVFSSPERFDDPTDCALHADLRSAILETLPAIAGGATGAPESVAAHWLAYEQSRRADWLLSSWTNIADYRDDKLLWYRYAGGPTGVGVTARYGELRRALAERVAELAPGVKLESGSINYDPRVFKLPPFNKRSGFRGEKEVRFALPAGDHVSCAIDLADRFGELFGLRLSEDAPEQHREAVTALFAAAGGNVDRINEG